MKREKRVGKGEREWEEGKESGKRGKRVGRGEKSRKRGKRVGVKRVGRGEREREEGKEKCVQRKLKRSSCIGQIIFVLPILRGRWF